jgi:predicted restriction endonuclease
MKMGNIASLDPAITSTGRRGLGNASAADRAMWEDMNADWNRFAVESRDALEELGIIDQVEADEIDVEVSYRGGLDRPVETTARVGQDFFRAAVLSAYDQKCCITGLSIPRLLIASHIIPWRLDTANRVNPKNGLLLSALHDRAFDAGLLTIDDDMTVRVSPSYPGDEFFSTSVVAYHGRPIRLPERFQPDREFLAYHREKVFVG